MSRKLSQLLWHVPPERHSFIYSSKLLTKNITRVCVTPFHPTTSKLNKSKKANKQIQFGSKAIASLQEFLCHYPFNCSDILLEELFSYLATLFPSHFFDRVVYESSDNESSNSIDFSISIFYCNDSNYLS